MNRLAGILDESQTERERETRLRQSFGPDGSDATIIHPMQGLSVAYSGDAGLHGDARSGHAWSVLYGIAHGHSPDSRLNVDQPDRAAELLVAQYHPDSGTPVTLLPGLHVGLLADGVRRRLYVFSDMSGNRSVFTAQAGHAWCFASHPLVCARLAGPVRLDRRYEDFLLVYGFLPDEHTIYREVRAVPAGKVAVWDGRKPEITDGAWDPPQASVEDGMASSGKGLYKALYERLLSCIETQLPADPDVAVLLGGFDSALVAAMLHRLGKRVHTYSFRYADDAYNQRHTDTLQRYLGNDHHWVDIDPGVIADGLQSYGELVPQPTNWMNYVAQTVHVCQIMRNHGLRFAYSGDGCDTLFLGYPGTYRRTRIFAGLPRLPTVVVSLLLALARRPTLERHLGHPYRMLLNVLRSMGRPMPARAFLTFRILDEFSLRQLRQDPAPAQAETVESLVSRLAAPHAHAPIQRLGYLAKTLVSPNRAKLCAAVDASAIRVLSPYLHPQLKAFTSMIPAEWLRVKHQDARGDPGKRCLMMMAETRGLLPAEIIYQPKLAAIDSPIDEWFAGPLRQIVLEQLKDLPFRVNRDYMDALICDKVAERLYKRHLGSTRVISDAVSLLVTYAAGAAHAPADQDS